MANAWGKTNHKDLKRHSAKRIQLQSDIQAHEELWDGIISFFFVKDGPGAKEDKKETTEEPFLTVSHSQGQ